MNSGRALRAGGDDGRTALYAAEAAAFDGTDLEEVVAFEDARRLVARITSCAWWPGPAVRLGPARSGARSSSCRVPAGAEHAAAAEIRLAAPQTTVATIAHELAHALAGPAHGHDAVFGRAYLDVIAVATNLDSTDRRGSLHVDQLAESLHAAGFDIGVRAWPSPPPTFGGPIPL